MAKSYKECVSIHAPVWVRQSPASGHPLLLWVSIHAPVWVRPTKSGRIYPDKPFQFTHPCGCDAPALPAYPAAEVSIHAPVWVRLSEQLAEKLKLGFQFTHPCGCDTVMKLTDDYEKSFNSRTRVGATRSQGRRQHQKDVSIHAPVWVRRFSFRGRERCTRFQFTHPCGCDGKIRKGTAPRSGFNSRTRVGATLSCNF